MLKVFREGLEGLVLKDVNVSVAHSLAARGRVSPVIPQSYRDSETTVAIVSRW